MTGDDGRQDEIEAATDALLADSGLPRYGGHRATVERRMRIAFEAADRVRDARSDEARCEACGCRRSAPCDTFGCPIPSRPSTDDHEHEWVDARNEVVESGEICIRCGAARASTDDQPKETK